MSKIYAGSQPAFFQGSDVELNNLEANQAEIEKYSTVHTATRLTKARAKYTELLAILGDGIQSGSKGATLNTNQISSKLFDSIQVLKDVTEVCFANAEEESNLILSQLQIKNSMVKTKIKTWEYANTISQTLPIVSAQLIAKGVNKTIIDELLLNSNSYLEACSTQSKSMNTKTKLTAEQQNELNLLYLEISGWCKIAKAAFRNDPMKEKLFNYTKIIQNFSSTRSKKQTTTDSVMVAA